ncbi:MAG: hypothetical protein IPL61_23585 [Myxococcales bacterium]|nr:hypothetical protein [Myxococcales bacterium]
MKRLAFVALVAVAACGGKSKTGSVEHVDTMDHAQPHEGDHPAMPAAVAAFHEQLSPLWHAPAGPERTERTCGDAGSMDQLLEEVEQAGAPANVEATEWDGRVTALRVAWTLLADDCTATNGANFEEKFTTVHDTFHELIGLLPMADK